MNFLSKIFPNFASLENQLLANWSGKESMICKYINFNYS